MKKIAAILAIGTLLTGATTAQAESGQHQQVADCTAQLTAAYGKHAHVRIIGRTSLREPALLLRVHPKGEKRLRVSCRTTPDGGVSVMDRYGIALALPAQQGTQGPLELF